MASRRSPAGGPTPRAAPPLRQEALAAQSAHIDTVSGATVTSDGYRERARLAGHPGRVRRPAGGRRRSGPHHPELARRGRVKRANRDRGE
ncbi:FMN-binding protein [Micromonospora rhizosphaerae]|uniref:FMN-binding protein n=1 Tax=Micromonospora rhizosphaerae TaxID=568872 RepID=UPI000B26C866